MTTAATDLTPLEIAALCRDMGFSLPGAAVEGLGTYLSLLCKWNRVMNLVGPHEPAEILTTLVADSLHLADFLRALPLPAAPECWDLGAGAGLPGIPLRLLWSEGTYTLVEAREKRALFLQTILASCTLPGTAVFKGRVEAFMPTRPAADLIVSRAFMPWERLLELVQDHLAPNGLCVFLTLTPAPDVLPHGWTCILQRSYDIAGDSRYLWAFTYTPVSGDAQSGTHSAMPDDVHNDTPDAPDAHDPYDLIGKQE